MTGSQVVKKLLVNTALVLLSISCALIAFDVVVYVLPKTFMPEPLLRLVQQMEINSGSLYQNHPDLGFTIKPNTDLSFHSEEFHFRFQTRLNYPDAGFRGGTVGGPVWGAAFGDSFTFGAGVDQSATWVGQLAKQTNREIINFGVPGQGPHQYTRIFLKYGVPLRPKVVFYAVFTNDLKDGQRIEGRYKSRAPKFSLKRFLKQHSASNNLFRNLSRSFARKVRDKRWDGVGVKLSEPALRNPYSIADSEFESAWASIAQQIDLAVEESKRIDATFVLLYFPSKEEVYWERAKNRVSSIEGFEERIARLSKATQSFCQSRKLLCLDLSAALKGQALKGEVLYFPIDIHWNQQGHFVVAQEIIKFLSKHNLINGSPGPAAEKPNPKLSQSDAASPRHISTGDSSPVG